MIDRKNLEWFNKRAKKYPHIGYMVPVLEPFIYHGNHQTPNSIAVSLREDLRIYAFAKKIDLDTNVKLEAGVYKWYRGWPPELERGIIDQVEDRKDFELLPN